MAPFAGFRNAEVPFAGFANAEAGRPSALPIPAGPPSALPIPAYGAHVFPQMALGFAFCGASNTLALCCTAVGEGRALMVATYLRQLVVPIPLFVLLRATLGMDWACLAFAAGDACAALYAWRGWRRLS